MSNPTLISKSQLELRHELETMAIKDLLGPAGGEHEEISEASVRDRYLVGMLAPLKQQTAPEEQDDLERSVGTKDDGAMDIGASQAPSMFPSSLGLTCCIEGEVSAVLVQVRWGWYQRHQSELETTASDKPKTVWKRQPMGGPPELLALQEGEDDESQPAKKKPFKKEWHPDPEQPAVKVRVSIRHRDGAWILSVFLVNGQEEAKQRRDSNWLFQPEIVLFAPDGAAIFRQRMLLPKPNGVDTVVDDEDKAMLMRYRHQVEFAVGHSASVHATLQADEPTCATRISTCAIPVYEVPMTTEPTSTEFPALTELQLDMRELAAVPDGGFAALLQPLLTAYASWITNQASRVDNPAAGLSDFRDVARTTLEQCRVALGRIQTGIALLDTEPQAAEAFRFANRAMWQQRIRGLHAEARRRGQTNDIAALDLPANRSWRVFQLAFMLLNLPALTDLHHNERADDPSALADLLWYPTGGGKTEAYLGLTAYTLAIRRLQGVVAGRSGLDGIAVMMRYTLRLLTLQQFQRATTLICACEMIRREANDTGDQRWGTTPFRVGLWVGQRTTPNTTIQSKEAIKDKHQRGRPSVIGGSGSPAQLTNCPWCGTMIDPGIHIKVKENAGRTLIYCGDPLGDCPFSERRAQGEGLPVLVVDEEIYRLLPALLIATVDKFAQLPWNGRTQMLFGQVDGYCERHGFCSPEIKDEQSHRALPKEGLPEARTLPHGPLRPPDLIIQDELHLISGPLGTLVGLYEAAIDRLCTWDVRGRMVRPKVVASTATVRRADQQIHALFLRKVNIFPPPGLDAADTFFAIQRPITSQTPGRRYLGICAIGKRQKAVLIRVYGAMLAAAQTLYDQYGRQVDPWMTLVGYFNAMRDLGGARRLVEDDIRTRLSKMEARGLANRSAPRLEELTSRKGSGDIPRILDWLEVGFDPAREAERGKKGLAELRPLDVLLATNMISVGVDVKRLGLMVVNGQPKTTSEYIQATSRVGRSTPGLVCTIMSWSRPRDLSHYEQFEHYHATFYQHVEALSVTPFSSRALDRGLSALLVALIRLHGTEYTANAKAGQLRRDHPAIPPLIEYLAQRAELVSGKTEVANQVRAEINERLDLWLNQAQYSEGGQRLGYRRAKDGVTEGLLRSTQEADWQPFTCLNSLRDVEATSTLLLNDKDFESGGTPAWTHPVVAVAALEPEGAQE